MIIYNYDADTLEFTEQSYADLDPEQSKIEGKDMYLIPANSTTIKPPKAKKNEVVLWNETNWKIEPDYRDTYIVDATMQPYKYDKIGELPDGFIPITDAQAEKIIADKLYYVIQDNKLVKNPNYEADKAAIRENEFNKAFFNTSLGYIRRAVTMSDGSKKDFLSDLLPIISMGVQTGQTVNVLAYDKPPFDEDVTDWTKYQYLKAVTPQFIQECFMQLSNDFLPINEE